MLSWTGIAQTSFLVLLMAGILLLLAALADGRERFVCFPSKLPRGMKCCLSAAALMGAGLLFAVLRTPPAATAQASGLLLLALFCGGAGLLSLSFANRVGITRKQPLVALHGSGQGKGEPAVMHPLSPGRRIAALCIGSAALLLYLVLLVSVLLIYGR